MMKVKPVKLGKTERMSFSHIDEVISMPNLIEVQKNSYQWFLDEGLKEVFHDIGTIEDYTGNLALSFVDFRLDKEPKYSIKECKERDVTYAAPLRVTARLLNKETGEVKDQEIFMGDFPLMTDAGTFVINGAERAIVSQLVRSPGVFYGDAKDKVGNDLYSATMNPNRGAWLEYETDASNVFYVRIDKNRKLPVTVLCRALGLSSDEEILNFLARMSVSWPLWRRTPPRTGRGPAGGLPQAAPRRAPHGGVRYQPDQHAVLRSTPLRPVSFWPLQDEQEAVSGPPHHRLCCR